MLQIPTNQYQNGILRRVKELVFKTDYQQAREITLLFKLCGKELDQKNVKMTTQYVQPAE